MILSRKLPVWIRPYIWDFLSSMVLTVLSSGASVVIVAQWITFGFPKELEMFVAASALSLFVWIQSFLVLRAHPRAVKTLVVILLMCLVSILAGYKATPNPKIVVMFAILPLTALWLMNTRRYRGLWKRLCVMRRRRTRQRRLIRQLKRMRRR